MIGPNGHYGRAHGGDLRGYRPRPDFLMRLVRFDRRHPWIGWILVVGVPAWIIGELLVRLLRG